MPTSHPFILALILLALTLLTGCEVQVSPLAAVPGGTTIVVSGTATPSNATDATDADAATELVIPTATAPTDATGDGTALIPILPTDVTLIQSLVNVNIRRGPGLAYDVVSFLPTGQTTTVTGVSEDGGWWSIPCPNNTPGCWIVAEPGLTQPVEQTTGGTASIPDPEQ